MGSSIEEFSERVSRVVHRHVDKGDLDPRIAEMVLQRHCQSIREDHQQPLEDEDWGKIFETDDS